MREVERTLDNCSATSASGTNRTSWARSGDVHSSGSTERGWQRVRPALLTTCDIGCALRGHHRRPASSVRASFRWRWSSEKARTQIYAIGCEEQGHRQVGTAKHSNRFELLWRKMTQMALFGHGAMSDLSPVLGVQRKLDFCAVRSAFDPACVKTAFNDMILLRFAGGFDDALCRWR